jgi:hypothetical protein
MRNRTRLGTIVGMTGMLISLIMVTPAHAATNDATEYCDAYNLTSTAASVPDPNRIYMTSFGVGDILYCGNGKTWGAVHIERKHKPPSWAVADRCAEKVERYGSRTTGSGGKTTFSLRLGSPDSVGKFVVGNVGVITNYVTDNRWGACADY